MRNRPSNGITVQICVPLRDQKVRGMKALNIEYPIIFPFYCVFIILNLLFLGQEGDYYVLLFSE
jgi:hypothetical protein